MGAVHELQEACCTSMKFGLEDYGDTIENEKMVTGTQLKTMQWCRSHRGFIYSCTIEKGGKKPGTCLSLCFVSSFSKCRTAEVENVEPESGINHLSPSLAEVVLGSASLDVDMYTPFPAWLQVKHASFPLSKRLANLRSAGGI
ncbi:hypothetical protein TWF569_008109 [Orbilia oligospora]|uniref:Uncharacterized protein n=1 Tax=Orbilia oligospora TaxID=2813651 RepID=A0A7C8JGI5_ORBOL|nr:hypothetical protein TWF706_009109 [Orbilia oligospora]KAF3100275.1 hypothetical protein TWF103_008295 [Orbilia oligospora]KAF3112675.1 hypothetical protein TWF102_004076 [Orbilia oligospora]KAF3123266.1 hypothetical protein TWF594_002485 [Orbilia oligospora]KAF3141228.1 hypothetical protein TWF569_008109 [Orbilia oligospora]